MTTNSGKVIKTFSCPSIRILKGTIRTDMYRLKSTEGEDALKTVIKLTHLKKNHLKNRQVVQTPISHSTLKVS